MITDELTRLGDYASVHPAVQRVVQFLAENDLSAMPDGTYPVSEDGECFVSVQTIPVKSRQQARLESHRKMADIQIPLTADEIMGYAPVAQAGAAEYDEQKDISFHPAAAESHVRITKGMFAMFFPQDAHAPGITETGLRKAVFKIPVCRTDIV